MGRTQAELDQALQTVHLLDRKTEQVIRGDASGKELGQLLKRRVMMDLQRKAYPGATSNIGAKTVKVDYRQRDGYVVEMMWDVLPPLGAPTVLGFCPACFVRAPRHIDPRNGTAAAVVQNQVKFFQGNPESDEKLVTWHAEAPRYHITLDERDRLTIRELLRCPLWTKCGWVVRVENGVAHQTSARLRGGSGGRGGPIRGPLIIVK